MKQYQILADEGWTHTETPPDRYQNFTHPELKRKYWVNKQSDDCDMFEERVVE